MKRRETPGAADKLVKYLKTLFEWAIHTEHATFNPAKGVRKINKSKGFHSWSEREIAVFRANYPFGTTARLAFELLLNLGVRRSDVVQLGPANIIGGRIEFVPQKGDADVISLPITGELSRALEAQPCEAETYLVTEYGKAFPSNGFGNKMRQWCDEIGLKQCSSHGLRKASATILAEAGATEKQLMAIFGWSDSKMVHHYSKAAEKKRLADAGFELLQSYWDSKSIPLSTSENSSETKRGKNARNSMPMSSDIETPFW